MILALPLMILMLVFMMLSGVRPREWAYILSHLATLFVVAMVCHGELARRRPYLTYPAAGCDWRLRQGNISYVHDLDSDRTFTIGAEFEYFTRSRGKPYTNSPPRW
jgi:hypothetical protein